MSIKLMSQVWSYQFTPAEQQVMLSLADHADDRGRRVFPSIALTAWKTGYSESQTRRIIRRLEARKILVLIRKEGFRRPREYRIDLFMADEKPPFRPDVGNDGDDEKGGILTPIEGEKGVIGDEKGVILGQKGVIAMTPEPSYEPSSEPSKDTAGKAPAGLPPVEDDPWAGFAPQEVIVPLGGNKLQRSQYTEKCDQCNQPLSQDFDICPAKNCGRPVKWVNSPAADDRAKNERKRESDAKAAARRADEARLSETVRFVLSCARSSPASAQTTYNKGQAEALQALVNAYGPQIVKDKANEFKANGERGMGLIKHLIAFMQQYNPPSTKRGTSQQQLPDEDDFERIAKEFENHHVD